MSYTVKVGKRTAQVETMREASEQYARWRGEGESMRRMRNEGQVVDASGAVVATITHNAKVWAPGPWASGKVPMYDPTA